MWQRCGCVFTRVGLRSCPVHACTGPWLHELVASLSCQRHQSFFDGLLQERKNLGETRIGSSSFVQVVCVYSEKVRVAQSSTQSSPKTWRDALVGVAFPGAINSCGVQCSICIDVAVLPVLAGCRHEELPNDFLVQWLYASSMCGAFADVSLAHVRGRLVSLGQSVPPDS